MLSITDNNMVPVLMTTQCTYPESIYVNEVSGVVFVGCWRSIVSVHGWPSRMISSEDDCTAQNVLKTPDFTYLRCSSYELRITSNDGIDTWADISWFPCAAPGQMYYDTVTGFVFMLSVKQNIEQK